MKTVFFTKGFILKVFILFTVISLLTTCKKDDPVADLIEFVWSYSVSHPDGFTLDIETKTPVTAGIVVSYEETQNSFGKENLRKVIEHALQHDNKVGGWFNASDSSYYFDSDKVFTDGLMTEAIDFARMNHQLAIYDITNDSVIWIEYPKSIPFMLPQKPFITPYFKVKFSNPYRYQILEN